MGFGAIEKFIETNICATALIPSLLSALGQSIISGSCDKGVDNYFFRDSGFAILPVTNYHNVVVSDTFV